MRKTITLIVMTLNEITGMKADMPRVDRSLFNQIIVVDGGSTDGTIEYAKENAYELHVQAKKGIRNGYIEVFPKIRSDYVITFSPDGNSDPADLPLIVDKINEDDWDMVIASRYYNGIKSEDDDVITRFGNWMFTFLINTFHGRNYSDAMGIYRGYKTKLFTDLDLFNEDAYLPEKIFRTSVSIEPLLSIRAAKKKLRITEVESMEHARIGGVRKLQVLPWGATFLAQIFREKYYWK